jgi:FkbM family methyltransferase
MHLLLRILNRIKLLPYLNLNFHKTFNGVRYIIPLAGRTGADLLGEFETWMQIVLRRLIPIDEAKTFVDVGVNLGQTMLAVKSVSKHIPYIGFEPNPACVQFVSNLIKQNKIDNVTIIPAAVGATDGLAVLYRGSERLDDSEATIIKDFRETKGKEQIVVPVISTSSVDLFNNAVVGIIKIDVEGGELEVIETLASIIRRDHPFVICEILPVYDKSNTFRLRRQQALLKLMKDAQYVIFRIGRDGSLKKLENIGIHEIVDDSNYLFAFEQSVDRLWHKEILPLTV